MDPGLGAMLATAIRPRSRAGSTAARGLGLGVVPLDLHGAAVGGSSSSRVMARRRAGFNRPTDAPCPYPHSYTRTPSQPPRVGCVGTMTPSRLSLADIDVVSRFRLPQSGFLTVERYTCVPLDAGG